MSQSAHIEAKSPPSPSTSAIDEKNGHDLDSQGADAESLNQLDGQGAIVDRPHVWRKIDIFLLPVLTAVFFVAFLDKANVGNAEVAGLAADLHLTPRQYTIALTVAYIPYILIEIPSNLILRHVGANILLPTMIVCWGLVATFQGFVTNYAQFVACRFLIGLFEGGLLPGITLYLGQFYPRHKIQLRIAIFFSTSSLVGAFSGLIAAAIETMSGTHGRPAWSWIFILEGVASTVFGLLCYILLPRTPSTAYFLNPSDRAYITSRLRQDLMVAAPGNEGDDAFSGREVRAAFARPQVWLLFLAGFFNGTTLGGLAFFGPVVVAGLGYKAEQAQLMSSPPFAVTFVLSICLAFVADRYRCRGLVTIVFSLLAVIGFAVWLTAHSNAVRYGSLFLAFPGVYCVAPALGAWNLNNVVPYTRRATATALLTVSTNAGSILSTWLLGFLSPAPLYREATIIFTVWSAGIVLCAGANIWWLNKENQKKAEARARLEAEGATGAKGLDGLGDASPWFVYTL